MPDAFLALPREERLEALAVAATASGRPPHVLEKDVWVVWTLKALFEGPDAEHLVFKGGTSLSKAYGVIDRFSEDIDLTYDVRRLVGDLADRAEHKGDEALPPNPSQQKRWRAAVEAALPAWVEGPVAAWMQDRLAAESLDARVEAVADRLWIRHAPAAEGWGYMSPDVMAEFGGRSTGLPADPVAITCDAAAFLPQLEFPAARPRVMHIARTFWEKATAVHVFCRQGRLPSERLSRHWYDLSQLLTTGHAAEAIANAALAEQVAQHKTIFFPAKDVDYLAAVGGQIRLVPDGDLLARLAADYEAMLAAGLLSEGAPAFADLMDHCAALEAAANRG